MLEGSAGCVHKILLIFCLSAAATLEVYIISIPAFIKLSWYRQPVAPQNYIPRTKQ